VQTQWPNKPLKNMPSVNTRALCSTYFFSFTSGPSSLDLCYSMPLSLDYALRDLFRLPVNMKNDAGYHSLQQVQSSHEALATSSVIIN